MINIINKVLARFHLKLVSTEPVSLVEETLKYLNTIPKDDLGDVGMSGYVGDVYYVVDKITGKSYFRQQVLGTEDKYFNYDGNSYTTEEMREKLK